MVVLSTSPTFEQKSCLKIGEIKIVDALEAHDHDRIFLVFVSWFRNINAIDPVWQNYFLNLEFELMA